MKKRPEGKAATLTVSSVQWEPDGSRQSLQYTVPALFYQRGASRYVVYREPEDCGLGDVETILRIRPGRVSVLRRGDTSMRQTIAPGAPCPGRLATPYGTISFFIRARRVAVDFSGEDHGRVRLDYTMELLGEKTRIELELTITGMERGNGE
jgi:uncharacterized beta-barrel protein YwiB (DUF1934 family)